MLEKFLEDLGKLVEKMYNLDPFGTLLESWVRHYKAIDKVLWYYGWRIAVGIILIWLIIQFIRWLLQTLLVSVQKFDLWLDRRIGRDRVKLCPLGQTKWYILNGCDKDKCRLWNASAQACGLVSRKMEIVNPENEAWAKEEADKIIDAYEKKNKSS